MKALSLRQPFAGLIIAGAKTIETRKWRTSYRGPLLICSSQRDYGWRACLNYEPLRGGLWVQRCHDCDLCRRVGIGANGLAVGIVDVVGCRRMTIEDEAAACCSWYSSAWSWILKNPQKIDPFPVKGRLRLFDVICPDMRPNP